MDEVIINNRAEMRRVEMAAGLEKQIERQAWMTVSQGDPPGRVRATAPLGRSLPKQRNRMDHRDGPAMERQTELEPVLKMRPRPGGNGRRNRSTRPPVGLESPHREP